MQDITGSDLKYQIIYRSKKNTYGMPNTDLTVPIPVSTGREYFSKPFVRKSYAALCTVYNSKQYSIPAVVLKYLPEENKYTEIPTGVKLTYRFITEQREISESYQNTYRGTPSIPKYVLGGANTGFYVGRYYFSNPWYYVSMPILCGYSYNRVGLGNENDACTLSTSVAYVYCRIPGRERNPMPLTADTHSHSSIAFVAMEKSTIRPAKESVLFRPR
jgi:hypothetical protein